ncbi:HAMP domain-containing sensor histidine kinase [Algicella marina]|uniref:HAMP domain-containing protein n=1 Tax=Algicella marina TaxID=2683284 RepID=A0A6P1SXG1_9RHOB|nr:histidine kinase [Algicella marina]QHQ35364.1 HAMP domain-containing protein [Algicella marina]
MSLRFRLVLTLWMVTALAGVITLGLAAADAYNSARSDTQTTLTRASYVLERNYHMEPRVGDPLYAEMTSIKLLSVMAPGSCILYEQRQISQRRLCAGWQVFGQIAPSWFRQGVEKVFDPPEPIARQGSASQSGPFHIEASFDPVAAATLAWQRTRLAMWQTLAMAAGVLALGTIAIIWRLGPVRGIVSELDRLSRGDLNARVESSGAQEFGQIAQAVNHLAERLRASAEQSRALTRKLIEVEDVERRQLARDLHDEFGQTLTATAALAASISYAAPDDRDDIKRDARAIGANIRNMMECLRGAFARLRPPDLEEVGLTASLRTMLSGWETQSGTRFVLDCSVDESGMDDAVALDLYRIVQECVTNAMRHGTPRLVDVTLRNLGETITLTVEDDGGGTLAPDAAGHGILGINERASAMGGALCMEETADGVRVAVTLPSTTVRTAA